MARQVELPNVSKPLQSRGTGPNFPIIDSKLQLATKHPAAEGFDGRIHGQNRSGGIGGLVAIKAVLFDMDGVLIDAKDWHYEALNDALRLFGMEINYEDHLAVYDGLPTRRKLEILGRTRGLPQCLHNLINAFKQRRTIELVQIRCRPMFHHQYALSRLKREGYSLAVCSNSVRSSVVTMMEQAALISYLEFLLSNEDVSKAKPDPEIYETAARKLGLAPSECLIVEDNEHGLMAARASGAHVLEVATVYDVTYDRIRREIDMIEQGA